MTETGDRDVVPVARTGNGRKQKKQMKHDVSFLSLSLSLSQKKHIQPAPSKRTAALTAKKRGKNR